MPVPILRRSLNQAFVDSSTRSTRTIESFGVDLETALFRNPSLDNEDCRL